MQVCNDSRVFGFKFVYFIFAMSLYMCSMRGSRKRQRTHGGAGRYAGKCVTRTAYVFCANVWGGDTAIGWLSSCSSAWHVSQYPSSPPTTITRELPLATQSQEATHVPTVSRRQPPSRTGTCAHGFVPPVRCDLSTRSDTFAPVFLQLCRSDSLTRGDIHAHTFAPPCAP